MTRKYDKNQKHTPKEVRDEDKRQASILIQFTCAVGLVACIIGGQFKQVDISPFTYAIFGGGILGTDNVLKLLRAIFRVGDGK